jgi:hypothetical protein
MSSLATLSPPRTPAGGSHGVLFLMLSIQLILISFFILLNTMATPKQKNISGGGLTGFAGVKDHPGGTGAHQATWDTGPMQVVKIHAELTGLVQTILRLNTPPLDTVATQVTIAVPLPRILTAENTLTTEGKAFVANIAQLTQINPTWKTTLTVQQSKGSGAQRAMSLLAIRRGVASGPSPLTLRMAEGPSSQLMVTIHPGSTPSPRSVDQLDRLTPAGSVVTGG